MNQDALRQWEHFLRIYPQKGQEGINYAFVGGQAVHILLSADTVADRKIKNKDVVDSRKHKDFDIYDNRNFFKTSYGQELWEVLDQSHQLYPVELERPFRESYYFEIIKGDSVFGCPAPREEDITYCFVNGVKFYTATPEYLIAAKIATPFGSPRNEDVQDIRNLSQKFTVQSAELTRIIQSSMLNSFFPYDLINDVENQSTLQKVEDYAKRMMREKYKSLPISLEKVSYSGLATLTQFEPRELHIDSSAMQLLESTVSNQNHYRAIDMASGNIIELGKELRPLYALGGLYLAACPIITMPALLTTLLDRTIINIRQEGRKGLQRAAYVKKTLDQLANTASPRANIQSYTESAMVMASILLTTGYLHQWAAKFKGIIPDLDHSKNIVKQLGVPLA